MSAQAEHGGVAYKIIAADEWTGIVEAGAYGGSAVDLADGYIHLSTEGQFAETAGKHYSGREGLMSLTVDLATLGDTVVWEPSRGGQLFPHIYGLLPVAAVTARRLFSVDANGVIHDEAGA
ncbi:DUF952 domain-containing protein [soil metagenome]